MSAWFNYKLVPGMKALLPKSFYVVVWINFWISLTRHSVKYLNMC